MEHGQKPNGVQDSEPTKDSDAMDIDEPSKNEADLTGTNESKPETTESQSLPQAPEDAPSTTSPQKSKDEPTTTSMAESGDVAMGEADQLPLSTSTQNGAATPHKLEGTSADGLHPKRPANLNLEDDQVVDSPEPLTTGKSLPDSARTPVDRARNGKHKRRRSTVIFPKQTGESRLDSMQRTCLDYAALKGASQDEKKDYLQTLFECQAYTPPRAHSLDHLINTANKTLTTSNHSCMVLEQHDSRILKRVYGLQNANRWSCRQMERSAEPPRPETVHDALLRQVKSMRIDFREERKWKVAVARNMANACAEWVKSSPDGRQAMQVRIKRRHQRTLSQGESGMQSPAQSTPDLVPSNGSETEHELRDDDLALTDPRETQPPAALFSLGIDDVVFRMEPTPIVESLLMELPQYDASKQSLSVELSHSIVPVSKFIGSKLASKHSGPPRKRRRYDYESEEDLPSYPSKQHALDHTISLSPSRRSTSLDLPAEQTNVALFNPENKHLRERLHASHAFRPPMEFPMPSTNFFESRMSSQWTWDEDQKLRGFVKDYSFNWSLISSHLQVHSLFNSGAERRTPWECFERWVQLEGLPAEMSKTPYFRTYSSRLEAAQRTIAAQQQLQQQQVQTPGSALVPPRRRTMQPMRVERRRNNRYLAIIDAMRKLARRKEQTAHKQQEAAKAAALRKAHEAAHPKTSVHTPQEFSRLRQERDQKLREKQEMMQQQLNMNNRVSLYLPRGSSNRI
jgi:chromatin modification-related protein VID21